MADPSASSSWLRRLTQSLAGELRDRDELIEIVEEAHHLELIDPDEFAMLLGVLEVSETQARDVMIPRSHMVVIERNAPPEVILPIIIESGHSRFPVIGEDRDEIVGILLAKDLLRFFVEGERAEFDIRECLRPAVFIPESKRLNTLLREFRASRNHMAIVVDEYGGVAGLLTIEDVIEEIVGDIDDEHDVQTDQVIQPEGERRYAVPALTRIDEFNDYFGTDFSDEEYDTIGGLVMHGLGRLPRRGETFQFGGLEFKVVRADRRRIDSLSVELPPGMQPPGRED